VRTTLSLRRTGPVRVSCLPANPKRSPSLSSLRGAVQVVPSETLSIAVLRSATGMDETPRVQ